VLNQIGAGFAEFVQEPSPRSKSIPDISQVTFKFGFIKQVDKGKIQNITFPNLSEC